MAWLHRLFLSPLCRKIPHGVPTLQFQGYHRKSTHRPPGGTETPLMHWKIQNASM